MLALQWASNRNEHNVNILTRNNWRTSLVPAPAVIPAPIAYIKVVAVKKLVVGLKGSFIGRLYPSKVACPVYCSIYARI